MSASHMQFVTYQITRPRFRVGPSQDARATGGAGLSLPDSSFTFHPRVVACGGVRHTQAEVIE